MQYRHEYHHPEVYVYSRPRRNYQATNGLTLMIIGSLIGSPFIFWLGFFEYATAPIGLVAAGGTAIVSAATIGFGALILYGSIGLAYLVAGARQGYKSDMSISELFKSNFESDNGWSFKKVVNAIGAALWSPFLATGLLLGKGVKALVGSDKNKPRKLNPNGEFGSEEELNEEDDNKGSQLITRATHESSQKHQLSNNGNRETFYGNQSQLKQSDKSDYQSLDSSETEVIQLVPNDETDNRFPSLYQSIDSQGTQYGETQNGTLDEKFELNLSSSALQRLNQQPQKSAVESAEDTVVAIVNTVREAQNRQNLSSSGSRENVAFFPGSNPATEVKQDTFEQNTGLSNS